MNTQAHTTVTTWPIFTRIASNNVQKSQPTEYAEINPAPISIDARDYEKIAEFIMEKAVEIQSNYYCYNFDNESFELANGCFIELDGTIELTTDFSLIEYLASAYNGQVIYCAGSLSFKAYDDQGDIATSNFSFDTLFQFILN